MLPDVRSPRLVGAADGRSPAMDRGRRATWRAAFQPVLVALAVGCQEPQPRGAPARDGTDVDMRADSASVIELVTGTAPTEFDFLGALPDGALLVLESGTRNWWRITRGGEARRWTAGPAGTSAPVLAAAITGDHLATVDRTGRIREGVAGASSSQSVVRRAVGRRGTLLGFARDADGSYLTLESRMYFGALTPAPVDTVRLIRFAHDSPEQVMWEVERAGPGHPYGSMTDFVALAAFGDTIVVTGSAPPRAIWWTREATRPTEVVLAGVPVTPMTTATRAAVEADLRRRGITAEGIAIATASFPAVVAARPFGADWFVVGGAGEERFVLSVACADGRVRVLLDAQDIERIFLLRTEAVIVRGRTRPRGVMLERTPYTAFNTGCSQ